MKSERDLTTGRAARADGPPSAAASNCRILLIDDDRHDRELAARAILKDLPEARIAEVADEAEFRAALAAGPYDAVVTDYALRWSDGLVVFREVRSRFPDIPVIMFTGTGTEEVCAEAMRAGISDYIVKTPIHYVRLPAAVRASLERAALARELVRREEENRRQREDLERANDSLERQIVERTRQSEQRSHQLRILAAELTKAEERERRRLAQMLHDDLQQMLVAARMHLSAVPPDASPTRVSEGLKHIDDLLDRSIRLSRNLTHRFSPPVLYDAGLAPALEWLARHVGEEHGLDVEADCDEEATPEAQDTQILLYQAVRELLFNVVKHAGVRRAKIAMHHAGEGDVQVSVCDEGKGFDAERSEQINRHDGFGLFSIRERLELIGGRMEIESVEGEGTCVRLYTPIQMTEEQQAGSSEVHSTLLAALSEAAPPPPPVAYAGTPIRVLLADDHRIMRASLAGLLRNQPGIEVVGQAGDGQQVIDLGRSLRPDVIVMDVTMPVVDGVEATRRLTAEFPQLSVIALSMHEKEDMQRAMREAGATRYLTKDGPPELLIAAIRSSARYRAGAT